MGAAQSAAEQWHEREKMKIELQKEKNKVDADIKREEMADNMKIEHQKLDLEIKRIEAQNAAKIAELLVQERAVLMNAKKDIIVRYMDQVTEIIKGNNSCFGEAMKLLPTFENDKLPSSVRAAAEKGFNKAMEGYMDTKELLAVVRTDAERLNLQFDNDYKRLVQTMGEKNLLSDNEKGFLLGGERKLIEQ
ncbi:hypothetical protein HK104_003234 [Borealophlyctis nickersoniae]|nr:hypothetical protein HK104_003234 [Borealophlyctis nickersoniae]